MPDLSNYSWGLPVQASTYAARIDNALMLLHAAMVLIFVLWAIYLVFCLVRYSKKYNPQATYAGQHGGLKSLVPDFLVLAFEIWLVLAIGLPLWYHIKEKLPTPEEDPLVVNLTAEQFAWTFQYPGPDGQFGKRDALLIEPDNPLGLDPADPASADDIVSVNELYTPVGRPVLLDMTSKDVIHSFFVPEFRIKQDAVPGMEIPVWVEPTLAGRFEIGCAQLCGTGHYRMRGDVIVQTEEEFAAWMRARLAAKGQ